VGGGGGVVLQTRGKGFCPFMIESLGGQGRHPIKKGEKAKKGIKKSRNLRPYYGAFRKEDQAE